MNKHQMVIYLQSQIYCPKMCPIIKATELPLVGLFNRDNTNTNTKHTKSKISLHQLQPNYQKRFSVFFSVFSCKQNHNLIVNAVCFAATREANGELFVYCVKN